LRDEFELEPKVEGSNRLFRLSKMKCSEMSRMLFRVGFKIRDREKVEKTDCTTPCLFLRSTAKMPLSPTLIPHSNASLPPFKY
jgi:hypothetical protein